MGEPYIRVENLSFSYGEEEGQKRKKRKYAVRDLSLSIDKGSFTAILGHNGSGKSTLAKLLVALIAPEVGEGKIFVGETEVTDPDLTDEQLLSLRRRVGMVFQNPDNQLVATVVEEDVAFGPENLGLPPAEIRKRVDGAMEKMGISEYAQHAPSKLSGGQKQRVAIAGLLAMQPECMIFDEATAMLDPTGRAEVMDIIGKLKNELGITVILITHNMDEAAYADKVVVMNEGEIALEGTPRQAFSQVGKLRALGLGAPDGTELLYELHKRGVPVDCTLIDPDECAREIYRRYLAANPQTNA